MVFIVSLAILEGVLTALLKHPQWLPESDFFVDGLRSVYAREDWSIPQTDLEMTAYDPGLTYLLRPGAHRFTNREFDVTFRINSTGLRDDEASLVRPEILVLGDSYALGWGVEQDETFSQVLERRTGLKVLNASMSSFGTAREVLLLDRLDTTAAKAVVVQYFQNDFAENRAFVENGFSLTVAAEVTFRAWAAQHQSQIRYRPLDYLRAFLDPASFFPELEAASPEQVVDVCLEILDWSEKLEGLPIFFLQIHPWTDRRFDITPALGERLVADDEYARLRDGLHMVDPVLAVGDFFRLDPHLRATGHAKVAREIERAMADIGVSKPR